MKTMVTFCSSFVDNIWLLGWSKKTFFLGFWLSLSFWTQAQTIELDKTFGGADGDQFTSVQQTNDDGYILGGTSFSGISADKSEENRGFTDYWLIKLDKNGKKVWDKTLGGNVHDSFGSMQQTQDGGYIVGGTSSSNKNSDKSENNIKYDDYWIIKLNATGQKEWDKTLGWKGFDNLTVIQQTPDGGYMVGGSSNSNKGGYKSENSRGYGDYWVIKLDATGKKQWDKTLGGLGMNI